MAKSIPFDVFEEARYSAGLFFPEMLVVLNISERTWYRWREKNRVPHWAYTLLNLHVGKLDFLGWDGWSISRGILTTDSLNPKYYQWTPGDILAARLFPEESRPGAVAVDRRKPTKVGAVESLRSVRGFDKPCPVD